MESISKTPVSAATARAIVADAFGNDVGVAECTELTEGWFNAAYSLTLDDGRRVVLKVAPPPDVEVLTYERDIIRAEVDALRLIGSRTDAPVPEVLWFDASARRVPSPLFLMTHVPGASLGVIGSELAADERAEVDALLGRHLRSINEISGARRSGFSPPNLNGTRPGPPPSARWSSPYLSTVSAGRSRSRWRTTTSGRS